MSTIEVIRDAERWFQQAPIWDDMALGRTFLKMDWQRSWWSSYGAQSKSPKKPSLHVLRISDGDATIGFAPLCIQSHPFYGRVIEWIGGRKACSDRMTFLALPGREADVARAIANELFESGKSGTWDRIQWDGMQIDASTLHLRSSLEARGMSVLDRPGPSCWAASIGPDWEAYLMSLSKRARKILRSQQKSFLATGRACIREPKSLDEVSNFLQTIESLHQKRWREKSIDGCFSDGDFSCFLSEVTRRHFLSNQLYIALMELDGSPAAGAIGFWEDDRLCLYLVGMDPDRDKDKPGWTLNAYTIQTALSRRKYILDFLRGDEAYKARLGAIGIPQGQWVLAAPRAIPRLRHAAYRAGTWLKQHWNRSSNLQEAGNEDSNTDAESNEPLLR